MSRLKKLFMVIPLVALAALCASAIGRDRLCDLRECIERQQEELLNLKAELEWQTQRSAVNRETAELEKEAAELELEKLVHGDGPMEEARLRSALKGAECSYESVKAYASDLEELKEQGYFNAVEYREAQDVLRQKKSRYETAQLQLDCFLNYVHPMRLRKAENHLRRCQLRLEEVVRQEEEKLKVAAESAQSSREKLLALFSELPEHEREIAILEE